MGLASYALKEGWRESVVICVLKLAVQPILVYLLARLMDLSPLQTQVVVLLAACPTGANVYLMARQFGTMEAPIASSGVVHIARFSRHSHYARAALTLMRLPGVFDQ